MVQRDTLIHRQVGSSEARSLGHPNLLLDEHVYEKDTIDLLNRLCQEFLWGFNAPGNPKLALVAWDIFTRERAKGSLGIKDITSHGTSLLSRWIPTSAWTTNGEWRNIIHNCLLGSSMKDKRFMLKCGYSLEDFIFLARKVTFKGAPTLKEFWHSWLCVRGKAKFHPEGVTFPAH